MSPLGELYRREAARLAQRWPEIDTRRLDAIVTVSLARAFLDVEAAELAQAMAEGSLSLEGWRSADVGEYIIRMVAAALAIARSEWQENGAS